MSHRVHTMCWLAVWAAFSGLVLKTAVPGYAQEGPRKRVLFLTKSSGFEHSVVKRPADAPDRLSHAERILVEIAGARGYEVTCTKDASLLTPENLAKYDVLALYTTGDLTRDSRDGGKGMTPAQKNALLQAIENGKGVLGFHTATDTFNTDQNQVDPYTRMIGGQFAGHGSQQKAIMRVVFRFPGLEDLRDFELLDEWYTQKNINPDMTVILVQDTSSMKNDQGQREKFYQRPPYPATWARMHGKGRVFYTSMGHREDVWTNPIFQKVALAGLDWVAGRTHVELVKNIEQVTPGYDRTTLE